MNESDSLEYWKRRCADTEKVVKFLNSEVEHYKISNMGLSANVRALESRIKMLEGRDG